MCFTSQLQENTVISDERIFQRQFLQPQRTEQVTMFEGETGSLPYVNNFLCLCNSLQLSVASAQSVYAFAGHCEHVMQVHGKIVQIVCPQPNSFGVLSNCFVEGDASLVYYASTPVEERDVDYVSGVQRCTSALLRSRETSVIVVHAPTATAPSHLEAKLVMAFSAMLLTGQNPVYYQVNITL